jgi:hypothetical protein
VISWYQMYFGYWFINCYPGLKTLL